ncbi:MAG: 50S ribosomal protein L25/general stress protein Ctc [Desulfosarcinaceae bacterium]|nr:50S ribosomal protein L25/general stress protein Ctc [Desulfosarcinaceae bacterium]
MDLIDFNVEPRTTKGDGPARALRREGLAPAVLYGPKTDPELLTVNSHAMDQLLKTASIGQTLLNLQVAGASAPKTAIIKEMQRNVMTGEILHVDFYEVDMDRKIRVQIPVVATGKSKGVEMGGMLQIIRREVEVLCYPNQIPDEIEVDITDLDVGESFHVEDLTLAEGIEIPHEANFTLLTILAAKAAEEEAPEEEEEEAVEGEEAPETETEDE